MTKYQAISDDAYHALPYLSQSKLKALIDHGWCQFQEESKKTYNTESTRFGTIAHAANLMNAPIDKDYVVFERLDGRTAAGKAQKKSMEGVTQYIFEDELSAIMQMNANFKNHVDTQHLMNRCPLIENYGVAQINNPRYPKNEIFMKFKPDAVGPDLIVDYKTIGDYATDKNIAKAMKNYHYPFQAAAYLILDSLITGTMKKEFYWIFQETIPPYGCKVVTIDQDTLQIGFDKFDVAITKYMDGINYPEKQTPNYRGMTQLSLLYY